MKDIGLDEIIPEPLGGAHNNKDAMYDTLKNIIIENIDSLIKDLIKSLTKNTQVF